MSIHNILSLFFVFSANMPKRVISPEERERRAIYMRTYRLRMGDNDEYVKAERARTRVRALFVKKINFV